MTPILTSAAGNPENQDRGLTLHIGGRWVLCVADGAGGRSGGTEAAVMAIESVRQHAAFLTDGPSCVDLLQRIDAAVSKDTKAGETTCALAVVTPEAIFGASVGDSGAWLIPETGPLANLTGDQRRKPFIGSGGARAVSFRHTFPRGIVLLATDGLLKYTSGERIVETCRMQPTELAVRQLTDLVRYSSGALPDDVTVILAKF